MKRLITLTAGFALAMTLFLPGSARAAAGGSVLRPGESLKRGQYLISANSQQRLYMQSDGNLVLYAWPTGRAQWASGTAGRIVTQAVMQGDGNFVIYNGSLAVWASGTANRPGSWLELGGDGNMYILRPVARWHTDTWVR